ncbi:MAG: hypothetical protein ACE5KG_02800 [Nitrososphaerales archaeon]
MENSSDRFYMFAVIVTIVGILECRLSPSNRYTRYGNHAIAAELGMHVFPYEADEFNHRFNRNKDGKSKGPLD